MKMMKRGTSVVKFDGMSGSISSDKMVMEAFRSRRVCSHAWVTC